MRREENINLVCSSYKGCRLLPPSQPILYSVRLSTRVLARANPFDLNR